MHTIILLKVNIQVINFVQQFFTYTCENNQSMLNTEEQRTLAKQRQVVLVRLAFAKLNLEFLLTL